MNALKAVWAWIKTNPWRGLVFVFGVVIGVLLWLARPEDKRPIIPAPLPPDPMKVAEQIKEAERQKQEAINDLERVHSTSLAAASSDQRDTWERMKQKADLSELKDWIGNLS